MVEIRIRDRNQLTVPMDIAQAAGIGPGSLCRMDYLNGVITIVPADAAPTRGLDAFAGIARGAWGASPEEIDRTIAADRDSWQR